MPKFWDNCTTCGKAKRVDQGCVTCISNQLKDSAGEILAEQSAHAATRRHQDRLSKKFNGRGVTFHQMEVTRTTRGTAMVRFDVHVDSAMKVHKAWKGHEIRLEFMCGPSLEDRAALEAMGFDLQQPWMHPRFSRCFDIDQATTRPDRYARAAGSTRP